jgi:hypothetical protein
MNKKRAGKDCKTGESEEREKGSYRQGSFKQCKQTRKIIKDKPELCTEAVGHNKEEIC